METLKGLLLMSCLVFMVSLFLGAGTAQAESKNVMTVKDVVDAIIKYSVGDQELSVNDRLITGTYDMEVTGIVTTFMATVDVVQKAIDLGANLIITHEPTFWTGPDKTDWLEGDPLYVSKKKLIEDNNIAIWRYHDYMHAAKPDGIYAGLLKEIGWENNLVDKDNPWIYKIEETTLADLAQFFKEKLSMSVVQIIGNPEMEVSKVGILVGGGSLGLGVEEMPMQVMRDYDLDVMVCGEIYEWTLPAYVNDAFMLGMKKGIIVLGHERTEEWGMKYMVDWLKPLVNDIPVTFVSAEEPFIYLTDEGIQAKSR